MKRTPHAIPLPNALRRSVAKAIDDHSMVRAQDRILIGLSGGKDSLTLVHVFRFLKRVAPVHFDFAAITVDYNNPLFCPRVLTPYLESYGIPHFLVKEDIVAMARNHMQKDSYTAFSSRIRRGIIYQTARKNGYNVVALAQHADDILASFFMSMWFQGTLQTMKASYTVNQGDLRVIRPLAYAREAWMSAFAEKNGLPIVSEEPPTEFTPAEQREKVKHWLHQQERLHPKRIAHTLAAIKPLLRQEFYQQP